MSRRHISLRLRLTSWLGAILLAVLLCTGCQRPKPTVSGPFPQRGYLWQRAWNPVVVEALASADQRLDGVIVLGAELHWNGSTPKPIFPNLAWGALAHTSKPISLGVRVAPFAGPFHGDDAPAKALCSTVERLLKDAADHAVSVRELQLDFDCAQKKLGGYVIWLESVRKVTGSTRLVITTLPAWLDEPAFSTLIAKVDGYVLQVHSVPTADERRWLCDSGQVRKWVAKAVSLKRPFSVALPTYGCLAGFDGEGRLLSVAMDSIQPKWPPGTRVLEFKSNPRELAGLIEEWRRARPGVLREVIWYRVPVATDQLNWSWKTLQAVMEGRSSSPELAVALTGENPVDVVLENRGDGDWQGDVRVVVRWKSGHVIAQDGLGGWQAKGEERRLVFSFTNGQHLQLPVGARRPIGWLRHEDATDFEASIEASPLAKP